MAQTSFDDSSIFEEMKDGFRLCGQAKASGAFPLGHQPAQQSVEELKRQARWLRASVIGKCKPFDGGDLDKISWDKTIKERDLGWISGPFSFLEMEQMMEDQPWIVTRRFPLQQKDKVRLIDDCLSSGLNSAYSSANKLRLMAVDALVSLFLCISGCMAKKGSMRLVLADGKALTVSPSAHWEGDCGLVGRTLDLESAYKQATSHPEDRWCRGIVVWNPNDKVPAFFITSALMFGSTAAVYAFNRLSKSLWHLQTCLNIMGTVYYDDFPMLDFKATSDSARKCSEDLLKLLGWQFAEDGRKALPFDTVFTVL